MSHNVFRKMEYIRYSFPVVQYIAYTNNPPPPHTHTHTHRSAVDYTRLGAFKGSHENVALIKDHRTGITETICSVYAASITLNACSVKYKLYGRCLRMAPELARTADMTTYGMLVTFFLFPQTLSCIKEFCAMLNRIIVI